MQTIRRTPWGRGNSVWKNITALVSVLLTSFGPDASPLVSTPPSAVEYFPPLPPPEHLLKQPPMFRSTELSHTFNTITLGNNVLFCFALPPSSWESCVIIFSLLPPSFSLSSSLPLPFPLLSFQLSTGLQSPPLPPLPPSLTKLLPRFGRRLCRRLKNVSPCSSAANPSTEIFSPKPVTQIAP